MALAAFYPALTRSFDERTVQPDTTESNRGFAMIADHYPRNEVLGDFVLISADRDMRNVKDLAALEQSAASVARTRGVESVRSITRPTGKPIAEASHRDARSARSATSSRVRGTTSRPARRTRNAWPTAPAG